jgi:hypothetical protein
MGMPLPGGIGWVAHSVGVFFGQIYVDTHTYDVQSLGIVSMDWWTVCDRSLNSPWLGVGSSMTRRELSSTL